MRALFAAPTATNCTSGQRLASSKNSSGRFLLSKRPTKQTVGRSALTTGPSGSGTGFGRNCGATFRPYFFCALGTMCLASLNTASALRTARQTSGLSSYGQVSRLL